jgi:large subunit ribosomal protein L21
MEAIVEIKGHQYKVKEGNKIEVPKLEGKEGDKVEFPILVLMGSKNIIGTPYVEGAKCEAEIVEFGRSPKIIVYKYKSKKRYRRKRGHRQQYTKILINKILPPV